MNKSQAESLLGVGPTHLIEFESLFSHPQDPIDDRGWNEFIRTQIQEQCERMGGFPLVSQLDEPVTKKLKVDKQYTPPIGSATWAVVIVMHLHGNEANEGMSLADILERTSPFVTKYPKTSKVNETVLKKLLEHNIIEKAFTSSKSLLPVMTYSLTEYGAEVASSVWQRSLRTENLSSLVVKHSSSKYELLMVVDTRELALLAVLNALGFPVESRALTVGDVLWVWRREKGEEYVAGYAIERKTMDDLSSSIKDGRYDEQRKRLARAPGIEKVIYVLEGGYEGNGLPEASLNAAIRHTELMPGFSVMKSESVEDTALLLLKLHEKIACMRMDDGSEEEAVITFREFNSETHKTKTLSISQQSAMMLRAIPGIGNEAILAIDEYLKQTGKGGITLHNVMELSADYNLNETIKRTICAKRIPFNQNALATLQEQYKQ